MSDVNQAFEARVNAKLDQQGAAIKSVQLQGLGILLAISLLGVAIAVIGKELAK